MADLTLTILGCGSSGGVPRLSDAPGGSWGACDPGNPRNRRQRCSVLLTRTGTAGRTRVLIDTSPDMRAQLLATDTGHLDAVVYTHAHADHTHGIDDLRMIAFNRHDRLPVWADAPTSANLRARFGYVFATPAGSSYPPILDLNEITGPVSIGGAGGDIALTPIPVEHGDIPALGFRIGDLAYIPDVSDIPDAILAAARRSRDIRHRLAALCAPPESCASRQDAFLDRPGGAGARDPDEHAQ